jgi:hypothetical protein
VTASDGESGLASDPSGSVPISTAHAGPVTVTPTAVDNVGHETTKSCTTEVEYPTPGAPNLSAGTNPNANGLFTLSWTGADPLEYFGLSYTLQHHNAATATWSTVASGIEALSYEFSGVGEPEGTWVYWVQGLDPSHGQTTEHSPTSASVVVDKSAPFPPDAQASREPDYAGGGGWYKDSVEVLFTSNGDRPLSDGSAGSGVDPASITKPQTVSTSGSHTVCGTDSDYVGHVSGAGCLPGVQVDTTPPALEIECPEYAGVGEAGVKATITASDGESGLASDPSGTVPIDTSKAGPVTITRTAVDNVGHETTKSCTTQVVPPPTVSKVKPPKGPATGGTTVTITGTNFSEVKAVKFGSVDAASFRVRSKTTITAVSPPAEIAGVVHVTVTTLGGTSVAAQANQFKYTPAITGLNPTSGPSTGGTSVTVQGAAFALGKTATVFRFGKTKAPSVNCTTTTECIVITPAHELGAVDVKATVGKVTSAVTPADRFTYN